MNDPNIIEHPINPNFVLPDGPYAEYLTECIKAVDPNIVALIEAETDRQMTYGEMHRAAQEFASALIELGIQKQDILSISGDNLIDLVLTLVGTVYLGCTFAPLSKFTRKYDFASSVHGNHATVLIIAANKLPVLFDALGDDELVKMLANLRLIILLDGDRPDSVLANHPALSNTKIVTFKQAIELGHGKMLKQFPHFPVLDPAREHFNYTTTSGTTGPPKRVIHSDRSFKAIIVGGGRRANVRPVPVKVGFKRLHWPPLSHTTGVIGLLHWLNTGRTVILVLRNDLNQILQLVEQHKLTELFLTPDLATLFAQNDYSRYNLSSLNELSYATSRLADHVVDRLRAKYSMRYLNQYGSSECLGHMLNESREFRYGNCGRVLPGTQMKIIDLKTRQSLPAAQEGEVCFRCEQVFIGYLDNEAATKEALDIDGWYHTGDMGYYDSQGRLFVTERLKEMIKFRFFAIVPGEIEDFLLKHDAVASVVVVGVPHSVDISWLRAYVQLQPNKTVTEQELLDLVAENLSSYKRLRAGICFVTEMPRTSVGKIERSHFKNLVKDELITTANE